jgi:hypothetical protein
MEEPSEYRLVEQPEGFQSVAPLPDPRALADFYAKLYYQTPQSASYQTAYSSDEMEQRYLRGRFTEQKLVIASHNKGKLREMVELMAPLGIEVMLAGDLGLPEPDETEDSYIGNATWSGVASGPKWATYLPSASIR